MGRPLHHFQGGVQHRIVDGRGGLADAAAHLVHRGAARVDGRGEVTLGRGTAAGGIIIGEHLSGHEHHAVAGLGGELHVVLAVGGAAHRGGTLTQQIPEQLGLQALLGLVGLGDGQGHPHGLPLSRLGIGGLGGLQVKVHAHHVLRHLQGIGVQLGVLGLGMDLAVHGVKVRVLGRRLVGGQLHRLGLHLAAGHGPGGLIGQSLKHQAAGLLPVHGHAGAALCEHQLLALHCVSSQSSGAAHLLVRLVQKGVQLALAGLSPSHHRVNILGSAHEMAEIGSALKQEILSSHLPRRLGAGLGIQLGGRAGKDALPRAVGEVHLHGALGLGHAVLQGLAGLGLGHSAHIHAAHADVVQNGVRAAHPGAQPGIGT